MAPERHTEVETVDSIEAGDIITIEGNGVDVTHAVEIRDTDASGRDIASFTVDGHTLTLRDSKDHPLTSGGLRLAGHGAVSVYSLEA